MNTRRVSRSALNAEKLTHSGKGRNLQSPCEALEPRQMLTTGTWTTIAANAPSGAQLGMVLTDGTIMFHGGSGGSSTSWYKLTPASNGQYTTGTFSSLASMGTPRLYFASNILQSGKLFVLGGEYSTASSANWINTGETYDPIANTWIPTAPFPRTQFGDDPSAVLPDGKILLGYLSGPQTYIYDPATNTYAQIGTKLRSDRSDEESWVKLPDDSILSYDVFGSPATGAGHAQRYIPSTGTWVDAGAPPAPLTSSLEGFELGPGLLLPDGRVFYAGATNNTAYYTPSTNSWAAGPAMPNGWVMADAPGAVLPDGNLLLAMSPSAVSGNTFPTPTKVYELDPSANIYTDVTPAVGGFSVSGPTYISSMVVLPTGQVALMNDSTKIAVYTEGSPPLAAAVPVVTGISYAGTTGTYTLSGTNLNGINEGAAYGDDNEMSSNYPLVRLTDQNGIVSYARTTNWSLTGVAQGAETVTFTLPAAATAGAYLVQSVANGVASNTTLAVLVNSSTTSTVTLQLDATPTKVDVVGGGVIRSFAISAFNSIYFVGDNLGDTLNVNLNSNAGNIVTTIQAGSATDTININQTSPTGPVVIAPSSGNDAVNIDTAGTGTALAQFQSSQQIGVLSIGSGGIATITAAGAKKLVQTNGIVTTGTGLLDVTRNDMIVHTGNLTLLDTELSSGLNLAGGVPWGGPGISSSTASSDTTHLTAVGAILNGGYGSNVYGTGTALGLFDGQNPGPADVLIKYTYFGDANLDGLVDGSDYTKIDSNFSTGLPGWLNGDFDYTNSIDGSDYALIDNAFNTQGTNIPVLASSQPKVTGTVAKATPSAAVAGWTVYADVNHDGKYDLGDVATTTDAKGNFAFSVLPIGDYWVRVKPKSGWSAVGHTGHLVHSGLAASPFAFKQKLG